jgi:hypothetical protein
MKVAGDECSKNDPWLVVLEKASELLEIATGVLVDGGHSFFAAKVKQIQDGINEQIEGEKAWERGVP